MDIYKRLDRKLVHKGKIIDLYEDTVAIPNGNVAKWDLTGWKSMVISPICDPSYSRFMVQNPRSELVSAKSIGYVAPVTSRRLSQSITG